MVDDRHATDETVALSPVETLFAGRYRIEGVIGRGGMGEVRRAHDTRLGRDVAIKLVRAPTPADAQRFAHEVRTLARLAHPHLVRVFDADEVDGEVFLVMELVEGPTLATLVSDGALRSAAVARLGADLADALAYVHRAGIVHRDVKPANVLVGSDQWAWLADFGIARMADQGGLTATGVALGTPAYLSPEQVEGKPVGPPVDVYALGLVLLEALTGRRAFEGTAGEVAVARLHRDPDIAALPEPWRDLLGRMTARDPAARPTADEVVDALGRLADVEVDARGTADDTAVLAAVGGTTATVALPTAAATARRRRVAPIGAALLVVALVGALVGLALASRGSPSSASPPSSVAMTAAHRPTTADTTSTTSTSPTTTVPHPTTPVGRAAQRMADDLQAGVANRTVTPAADQAVAATLGPFVQPSPPADLTGPMNAVTTSLAQAVNTGAITSRDTIATLSGDLQALEVAAGVTATPSTTTAPSFPPAPPGHQGHHGHGG